MPRTYTHKKRGKTMNYDTKQLADALKAHQNGMSIREASKAYNIPKSTLADRASGRYEVNVTHGRPCAIPIEVEKKIVVRVKVAAERGIGISRKQLLLRTNVLCQRIQVHTSYKNFHAGKNWWEGLKRRHGLTLRQPERLGSTRCRMMNRDVVGKYFEALSNIITSSNLNDKPEFIWNCDETSKNFEHNPIKVVSGIGAKNVCGRTSSKSTNITIMACVNAAGKAMPPMFIVKGKTPRSLYSFNTQAAPPGTKWSYQEKGWMTDQIGEQWFDTVFLQNCGTHRPQLLILDGHSSHESLAILQRAIEENIYILVLPPHTTHHLQPLDKSVFGPFNKAYSSACSEFLQDPLNSVNKWNFPALITRAWVSGLTEGNIKSGFAACGIFPLNKNAIHDQAYSPSYPSDKPLDSQTQSPFVEHFSIPQGIGSSSSSVSSMSTEVNHVDTSLQSVNTSNFMDPVVTDQTESIDQVNNQGDSTVDVVMDPVVTDYIKSIDQVKNQGDSTVDVVMDPVAVLDLLSSGDFIVDGEIDFPITDNSLTLPNSPCNISPEINTETTQCQSLVPSANWNQDLDSIFLPPSGGVPNGPVAKKTKGYYIS
ncbi:tigger transposable element-derived protein 6-like [Mercenaria mercenaria]|uniref:tigger transposable element-derived protein 6-like n=1 Tax=Mercenaria mercenaria TaxID=6596 RepID=UPI00234F876E|nr:tigger transposable element-derived protein 6-like [Mercenaria mercenaria]